MKKLALGDNSLMELRTRKISEFNPTPSIEKMIKKMKLQEIVQENNQYTQQPHNIMRDGYHNKRLKKEFVAINLGTDFH